MVCSKCGAEVPEGRKFCVKCGTAFSGETGPRDMAQRNANCAKCDAPLAPGRAFCGSCGNRVIPSSVGGNSSESLERISPISSTQKKLNDATEIVELTDPAMVSVLNSEDGQRTNAENSDALAVLGRYEEVENRPRASIWTWIAIAVAILISVGVWFMLHRPKQQLPPQVAPQGSSTTASMPTATAPVTVPVGLTTRTLANMDYRVGDALSELGERTSSVTLVDGKGSFGDWNAFLDNEHIAFGDLDGDGIDDAVVVLTFEGPGSAAPQILVAVTNLNGKGESTSARSWDTVS